MSQPLDPMLYDDLAEAGTLALRSLPGAVILELERRSELLILRHMFLELTVKQAIQVQAALAAAIAKAMEPPACGDRPTSAS